MRTTGLSLAVALLASLVAGRADAADWPQFGRDAAHGSNNPDESLISAANVAQMVRRYAAPLPSSVDSAPVYAGAIPTPTGVRDLVFLNASDGTLLALDAADGSLVWSAPTSGRAPTQSSPAIDPNRAWIYQYGVDGKVHKRAIGDGSEVVDAHWPQLATLKPQVEKGASALAIARNGGRTWLYAVTSGYVGDFGDYQGHLTTIDLGSGAQTVFNTLCSDVTIHMIEDGEDGVNGCATRMSGIWGRPGATFDAATGRVYITTGNGTFDAVTGGRNWGDSVLALNPDGTGGGAGLPLDSYTPTNYQVLDGTDTDLGSASLSILPVPPGSTVQHLGLQTGKDAMLRLIDLDDMSGSGAPGGVGGEVELISVPIREDWMTTQPAIWVDVHGDGATWVYMANGRGISGLRLTLTAQGVPHLQPTWQEQTGATSAIVANDVVFHAAPCSGGDCIMARDPHDGTLLWTSTPVGHLHWQSPIVVAGALYIASGTTLYRFDPGNPPTWTVTPVAGTHGSLAPDAPQEVAEGDTVSFTITAEPHYRIEAVTGCGGSLDGSVYTTAPVQADCTVEASFTLATHTVTPLAGANGQIEPGTPQVVADGDSVAFEVIPDAPYVIASVSGCNGTLAGTTYTTAPVVADCTVEANFTLATHTVTPLAGANGRLEPGTPQVVADGSTAAFEVIPDAPYAIESVTGCGGTLVGTTYTTAPVVADCTVEARFVRLTHVVTPRVLGGGLILPPLPQTVDHGATVAFTVLPLPLFDLVAVSGCDGTLEGTVYTTGPVQADCTVSAAFATDVDPIFTSGFEPGGD